MAETKSALAAELQAAYERIEELEDFLRQGADLIDDEDVEDENDEDDED
jgi:hypothetical protein